MPATSVAAEQVKRPPDRCAGMTPPSDDENHASIRLDHPQQGEELAVDEQGKIDLAGVLHKHASMVDVSVGDLVTTDFTIGPPPDGVSGWASSWATRLRPPELGVNLVCSRAERQPKRYARVLRSITVVDNLPPSNVTGLTVGDITATTARASWGAATDNYGLAGYEITVDGRAPVRTNVGTRSYALTGLSPDARHTVSVVAVDLAGNKSAAPATATFRTAQLPPEPDPDAELKFAPEEGGAMASWQPDLKGDATYRVYLDGGSYDEFPLKEYCQNTDGTPADPCTAQSVVRYPIEPLDALTSHTFRVEAVREDGGKWREFAGQFTTSAAEPSVPEDVTQKVSSEGLQCAAQGGDFYIAESVRRSVTLPAGATQVFPGCYNAADASCVEKYLPLEGNKKIDCDDDVTRLLESVAPPGRGPSISSLSGGTGGGIRALFDPGNLVQPITWCAQNTPTCTLVLAPPAVAAETAAASSIAAAVAGWVVVTLVGIGIGIVLGVLLAILFPSPIAIGGVLEYPIHYYDDFNTYKDWYLDGGRWVHSLKVYAQTVKTTQEATTRYHLPFAWNSSEDSALRRAIDQACAAQGRTGRSISPCGDNLAVYVPGGKNYKFRPLQETGTHIVEAMGNGGFPQPPQRALWYGPGRSIGGQAARNAGYQRNWFYTDPKFAGNPCLPRVVGSGKTCDEFPFWSTDQAVDLSGVTASVKLVPTSESLPQAQDISSFHSKCDVQDNEKFIVLPIKPWVDAGAPSFGFRVNGGGASLCMEPTP
ncbi:fibronectin type III domain-containing protein [Streptomyces griseosporeus]|uniref:fibronectin type III domain-containing protein n=1 Tax=Streptomyces griseosporeus TaxID=1910 RepID=UPI0037025D7B